MPARKRKRTKIIARGSSSNRSKNLQGICVINSHTFSNNELLNNTSAFYDSDNRQLDWRPEKAGEVRKRHEKVIIIRNMFHPSDFEARVK